MGGQPAFSGNTSGRSKGNMYGEAGRGRGQGQRRGQGGGDWKNQKSRLQMAQEEDALEATLDGKDCLAMLPTGAGKSLLYMLPAAMRAARDEPGLTVVVSPLLSGTLSYLIFRLLLRKIFYVPEPLKAAKRTAPYLVFVVFVILTLALLFKGLKNLKLDLSFPMALGVAVMVGAVAALVSIALVRRILRR